MVLHTPQGGSCRHLEQTPVRNRLCIPDKCFSKSKKFSYVELLMNLLEKHLLESYNPFLTGVCSRCYKITQGKKRTETKEMNKQGGPLLKGEGWIEL